MSTNIKFYDCAVCSKCVHGALDEDESYYCRQFQADGYKEILNPISGVISYSKSSYGNAVGSLNPWPRVKYKACCLINRDGKCDMFKRTLWSKIVRFFQKFFRIG